MGSPEARRLLVLMGLENMGLDNMGLESMGLESMVLDRGLDNMGLDIMSLSSDADVMNFSSIWSKKSPELRESGGIRALLAASRGSSCCATDVKRLGPGWAGAASPPPPTRLPLPGRACWPGAGAPRSNTADLPKVVSQGLGMSELDMSRLSVKLIHASLVVLTACCWKPVSARGPDLTRPLPAVPPSKPDSPA